MAAARKNLLVDLGTTWNFTFEYRFDGAPADLTGHVVELRIMKPGNSTSVYDTQAVDGTADARTTFTFEDEETAVWSFRKAAYTVDLLEPSGDRIGLLFGTLTVRDRADI